MASGRRSVPLRSPLCRETPPVDRIRALLRASVRGVVRLLFGRNPIDQLFHEVRGLSHRMNSLSGDVHGLSLRLNATEQYLRRAEAAVRVLSEGMAAMGSVAQFKDLDLLAQTLARGMREQGMRFETLQVELDRSHKAIRRTRDAIGLDGDGAQSLLRDSGTVLGSLEQIKGLINTVDESCKQRSQVVAAKLTAVQTSMGHWGDDTPQPFESVETLVDALLQLQAGLESVALDVETRLLALAAVPDDVANSTLLLRSHLENHHVAGYCPDQWLSEAKGIHDGERCYLLGCGPSLSTLDPELLRGHVIMGVNGTAKHKGLRLDYFMTVADVWWKQNRDVLDTDLCEVRRFLPPFVQHDDSRWPTSRIRVTTSYEAKAVGKGATPMAFSHNVPRLVHLGGTVIFPALQVLHHLGFSEVILLGVDHDYGQDMSRDKHGFVSSEELNHFDPGYYDQPTSIHCDVLGMERAYALADEAFRQSGTNHHERKHLTPGWTSSSEWTWAELCTCPVRSRTEPAASQRDGGAT